MIDFQDQARKLRSEFPSLTKLNSLINEEFLEKYGPNSNHSGEKFTSFINELSLVKEGHSLLNFLA